MEELRAEDPRWIGAYRLLGRLGAGGMGVVYLARSDRGRTVAVKLVQAELARQPDFRQRFAHEVEAARRVGGQWTAPVLDADTEAETPWVATGYIGGPSLHSVVSDDFGPLPEHSVRTLAVGLGCALRDIHGAGLVHRDLKPSNVLVTIDGPRVIDFGIARATETLAGGGLTMTGAVVGSPGFMSPEQVRGERVTTASDLFCLGSVLAFAATGRQPFGTANSGMHALMFRIAEEEPDLTGLPDGLRDVVLGCLTKKPEQRLTVDQVLERTGGSDDEPWLPGGLLARLGRDALQLLEAETPQPASRPETANSPYGPSTPPPATGPYGAGLGAAPAAGHATGFPAGPATGAIRPPSTPHPGPLPSTPPPPSVASTPPPQSGGSTPPPPYGPSTPPPGPQGGPWGVGATPYGPAPAPGPGPHPGPYRPQAGAPPLWKSARGLANALSVFMALTLLYALIDMFLNFALFGAYDGGENDDAEDIASMIESFSGFGALTSLPTLVLWLVWFWRLAVNTEVIAPGRQRFSRGWAVGSWFTPVVQLWFPKQMANDIWQVMAPAQPGPPSGPYGGRTQAPSRALLNWWWGTYCAMFALGFVTVFVGAAAATSGDLAVLAGWTIMSDLVALVAGVLALGFIQRLTSWQERMAPHRPY
ncbi:DUF4328 domain-containing protein [Streptomyces sp. NPDC047108]|uniref:protein kinase domain-containing protein n=1 Tax=Streptomyces sp. NPDC047108 TaxID=3155025 RepID=UPI00340789B4